MDIILFKDGSYKFVDENNIYDKKQDKIKAVLIHCFSEILGEFYTPIRYKHYLKTKKNISSITLKYSFFKGIDTGNEDEEFGEYLNVSETYSNINSYLTKIYEIIISELSLSEFVWSQNSAFYSYFYDTYKIKVKFNGKNKKKKFSYSQFMKEYFDLDSEMFTESVDLRNKKDFNLITRFNDIKGKHTTLARILYSVFVPVDSETLIKIKELKASVSKFLADDGVELEDMDIDELSDYLIAETSYSSTKDKFTKHEWINAVRYLWRIPMHLYVFTELYPDEDFYSNLLKINCEYKIKGINVKGKSWQYIYKTLFSKNAEIPNGIKGVREELKIINATDKLKLRMKKIKAELSFNKSSLTLIRPSDKVKERIVKNGYYSNTY